MTEHRDSPGPEVPDDPAVTDGLTADESVALTALLRDTGVVAPDRRAAHLAAAMQVFDELDDDPERDQVVSPPATVTSLTDRRRTRQALVQRIAVAAAAVVLVGAAVVVVSQSNGGSDDTADMATASQESAADLDASGGSGDGMADTDATTTAAPQSVSEAATAAAPQPAAGADDASNPFAYASVPDLGAVADDESLVAVLDERPDLFAAAKSAPPALDSPLTTRSADAGAAAACVDAVPEGALQVATAMVGDRPVLVVVEPSTTGGPDVRTAVDLADCSTRTL